MRRFVLIAVLALAALPAVALAKSSSAHNNAENQCRSERTHMGSTTFKATYGSGKNHKNAFGQCVSHRTRQNSSDESEAQTSAEKQCKAEQSDSSFASTHNGMTFDQKYGTNHNGKNAFGKCVSEHARSKSESEENEQVNDEDNAAQACRSEQKNDSSTFKSQFGSKSNAFGKCVSKNAHETETQQEEQQENSSS